jgi:hypothetical protein
MTRSRGDPPVTLEFISRQHDRSPKSGPGATRFASKAPSSASIIGQALNILSGRLEQIRGMVAPHQRFADRLRRLDRDRG